MIFVCGATGTVGRPLVGMLRARNAVFRLGVHSEQSLQHAEADGFDARVVDLDRQDTLQPAFDGVTTLFLLAPNGERQFAQELNALEAAKRAGVGSIVKLSAWRAPEREFSFARVHREIECAIEASGIAGTFLRPCGFMQNFSNAMAHSIRTRGAFHLPAGRAQVSHIDARDVAEVAAHMLCSSGYSGKAYALSGPSALSYDEAAGILSRVLGHEIRYVSQSEADAQAGMMAAGLPSAYVADVLDLFRAYRNGGGSEVTPDVHALLSRPATSFEQFVREFEGVFR